MRGFVTLVLLVVLAACDTSDPRQGGFLGGVGGILSGSYDDRLAQREATYKDALARRNREAAEREEIDRVVATRTEEAERLRVDIRELDADVIVLRRELDAIRTKTAGATARHGELSAELKRVRGDIAALERAGGEEAARRRDELRAEIEVLRKEIDILDDF